MRYIDILFHRNTQILLGFINYMCVVLVFVCIYVVAYKTCAYVYVIACKHMYQYF